MRELAQEILVGPGGLGRRRGGARRAPRARRRRPRHRLPRARGDARASREALRRGAVSALRATRRVAGRARRWSNGRLHAAGRRDRRRPRDRDFTINAIAVPLAGGEAADPYGGRADLEPKVVRAVCPRVFTDDPLRLLRAVRLEDELGFRLEPDTERLVREHAELVTQPARERTLAEFVRLSVEGYQRADELGLLAPLDGSSVGLERRELVDRPAFGSSPSSATRSAAFRCQTSSSGTRGRCYVQSGPRTDRCARSTAFGGRPSRGRSTPWPSSGHRSSGVRSRRLANGAGRAAPPRRRARPGTRAGDRTPAGADRRRARCRRDLDARRGARAHGRERTEGLAECQVVTIPSQTRAHFLLGSKRGGGWLYRFNEGRPSSARRDARERA